MATSQQPKPCSRCKDLDAPLTLREDRICGKCYLEYVDKKVSKRFGALHRDTRTSPKPGPRRYLAGLSFGPSSGVMVHTIGKTAAFLAAKKSANPLEPLFVHVDTDLTGAVAVAVSRKNAEAGPSSATAAQRLIEKYRERYPNLSFECVHLSKVLDVRTVDWSILPLPEGDDETERLRKLFDALPSASSRADVLRLLIRHLLLHVAMDGSYSALLLGQSTTALAALTLAEVANGRGYAVPWHANDGMFTVCTYPSSDGKEEETRAENGEKATKMQFPIYYPMREVFGNEISTYVELNPDLAELVQAETRPANVVSHKDQSIAEVMTRYFESVEGPYSGIVANVVRTTGKLDRAAGDDFCGLCGVTLDEKGDSRWAGEIGDQEAEPRESQTGRLCYGCRRSVIG